MGEQAHLRCVRHAEATTAFNLLPSGRDRDHHPDRGAHLPLLRRRVVPLHSLRLVPGDRAQDDVMHVRLAREGVESGAFPSA
jgi:hypothetical protein